MSNYAYTPAQTQAITQIERNVRVIAGAGSGKTKVLVKRFLYILGDNYPDDDALDPRYIIKNTTIGAESTAAHEILAITFTEKAGKEMAERIHKRLTYLATNTKDREYWQKRSGELSGAHVGTMHSLYSKIIRENPIEADISPSFTLLSALNEKYLTQNFIKQYLQEAYRLDNSELKICYAEYGAMQLDKLLHYIITASGTLPLEPVGFEQLFTANSEYNGEILDSALSDFTVALEQTFTPLNLASLAKKPKPSDLNILALREIPELFAQLKATNAADVFYAPHIHAALNKINANNKYGRPIKKAFQAIIAALEIQIAAQRAAQLIPALSTCLWGFLTAWRQYKRANNLLTFDDTERICLELLQKYPLILHKYRHKYKHIMIDEVQDLNTIQHQIINLLTADSPVKLFTVGDPKQSIYAFRGSGANLQEDSEVTMHLDTNFRSLAGILTACNTFFESFTAVNENNVIFDKLNAFRQSDQVAVRKIFYTKNDSNELDNLAKQILLLNTQQNIAFADMAILVRANKQSLEICSRLNSYNIPYNVSGRIGFFADPYIRDLINLLMVIHNKYAQVELIGILRSPFFNIRDNTIQTLLALEPSLWKALSNHKLNQDCEQQALLERACCTIGELSEKAATLPLSTLLKEILYNYHWRTMAVLQPEPLQNLANINKMLELVQDFEDKHSAYLGDFIEYLLNLRDSWDNEEIPNFIDSNHLGVNILSIHKAKGLEFQCVFLPSLEKINTKGRGYTDIHSADPNTGSIGLKMFNIYTEKLIASAEFTRIKTLRSRLDEYETLRILYVAMTRAKDQLFLSGTLSSAKNTADNTAIDWLSTYLPPEIAPDFDQTLLQDISPLNRQNAPLITAEEINTAAARTAPQLSTGHKLEKLTASSMHEYLVCPQMFEYRQILKIPVIDLPNDYRSCTFGQNNGANIGSLVHKILELCTEADQVVKLPLTALAAGLSAAPQDGLVSEAKDLSIRYLNSSIYQNLKTKILKKEYGFSCYNKNLGIDLNGFIDCIIRYADGELGIIDYKTGVQSANSLEYYKLQISLYSLVAEQLFRQKVKTTAIHHIGSEITVISMAEEELSKYTAKLTDIGREIIAAAQARSFVPNNSNCALCPYTYFCKYAP